MANFNTNNFQRQAADWEETFATYVMNDRGIFLIYKGSHKKAEKRRQKIHKINM